MQPLQLQHVATVPAFRTTSTLRSLIALVEAGVLPAVEARQLREAWLIVSRARSAMILWTVKTVDVLPNDRGQLDGVARLLQYSSGSASQLEED